MVDLLPRARLMCAGKFERTNGSAILSLTFNNEGHCDCYAALVLAGSTSG